jgi:hypothetical protein
MADPRSHDALIHGLGDDLAPVRRLKPPVLSALLWLGAAALIGAGLVWGYGTHDMMVRLSSARDLWLAAIGSLATAVLAALAAFELGRPGRSRLWALLPLPGLALWLGASGWGCLRLWALGATGGAGMDCLKFIAGVSVPLAVVMVLLLRRAFPLYPALTAALAGLACAAASATLLNICHPFDASATDLAAHTLAVAAVTVVMAMSGGRLLRR